MRIFALSDLHIDYTENLEWLRNLSSGEYKEDFLILAGDISDNLSLLQESFNILKSKFKELFFVPGNHDLWVHRCTETDSLAKFHRILEIARQSGVITSPASFGEISIVPLFGWYDYSFGNPSEYLKNRWADYQVCQWPEEYGDKEVALYFSSINDKALKDFKHTGSVLISFSHFLPRPDLMPHFVPPQVKKLLPVLGNKDLGLKIKELGSHIHVYGHHHLNRKVSVHKTLYINNAFGYPKEGRISNKELLVIHEA